FRRRRWIVLDSVAVVLIVLIVAGANTALRGGGQQSSQPAESIRGAETVKITASNGEGGGTPGAGICITARVQVPRDDAPDMMCGVTDGDGKVAFRVRPGKYYIYLDLRSRDEYSFDPKFPKEYVEWEVLPQSTNEIEVMITPEKRAISVALISA
ncbi:MAG: hypothetical protein M1380_03305, partial [Chloroflexi bacterium]|nr:hypothetical protein [Chloroflexota bacterium]